MWALIPDWLKKAVAGVAIGITAAVFFKTWLALHDASIRSDAVKGYVQQSELDASEARRIKAERDAEFDRKAASAARIQADVARTNEALSKEKLNAAIAQDNGDDGCRVSPGDLDWLRNN